MMLDKKAYLLLIVVCLKYARLGNILMMSLVTITAIYDGYCYSHFSPVEMGHREVWNFPNVMQFVKNEIKTQIHIFLYEGACSSYYATQPIPDIGNVYRRLLKTLNTFI